MIGFDIRNLYHFVTKKVPHTISQILRVTDIFKLGQIQKIVSFLERGSFTENNGTITNV